MPRIVNVCVMVPDTGEGCFNCPFLRLCLRGGVMAYRCAMFDKRVSHRAFSLPECASVAYACPVAVEGEGTPEHCWQCGTQLIKDW